MGKPGFFLVYTLIQGAVWPPYISRARRVAPLCEMEQKARARKGHLQSLHAGKVEDMSDVLTLN